MTKADEDRIRIDLAKMAQEANPNPDIQADNNIITNAKKLLTRPALDDFINAVIDNNKPLIKEKLTALTTVFRNAYKSLQNNEAVPKEITADYSTMLQYVEANSDPHNYIALASKLSDCFDAQLNARSR